MITRKCLCKICLTCVKTAIYPLAETCQAIFLLFFCVCQYSIYFSIICGKSKHHCIVHYDAKLADFCPVISLRLHRPQNNFPFLCTQRKPNVTKYSLYFIHVIDEKYKTRRRVVILFGPTSSVHITNEQQNLMLTISNCYLIFGFLIACNGSLPKQMVEKIQ